jgi:hypothetical protein
MFQFHRKARRSGVTLTEALIAVGIMAIGLVALMTFFPLAAVQMARSFKDDRTGTLAANMDNLFRTAWREIWLNPTTAGERYTDYDVLKNRESALQAMDDPYAEYKNGSRTYFPSSFPGLYVKPPYRSANGSTADPTTFDEWYGNLYTSAIRNNENLPSFPVMLDPVGYQARSGSADDQHWVAYANSAANTTSVDREFYLPRRQLTIPNTNLNPSSARDISRLTTLLDDTNFAEDGQIDLSTGQVERAGKYSCSLVIQRPRNNNRTQADVHVLTFQGRPGIDVPAQENSARITSGTAGSTSIDVYFGGGGDLPVYKGEWIIAVDVSNPRDTNFPGGADSRRGISFHRVLSVVPDATTATNFTVELQQPLVYNSTRILMLQGLVEVFDVGRVTLATGPKP